jgi:hypothetical protein
MHADNRDYLEERDGDKSTVNADAADGDEDAAGEGALAAAVAEDADADGHACENEDVAAGMGGDDEDVEDGDCSSEE